MGELFRKQQSELRALPPDKRPATEAQIDYLRRLCLDEDGEVDEAWLTALSFAKASTEIDKRVGMRR